MTKKYTVNVDMKVIFSFSHLIWHPRDEEMFACVTSTYIISYLMLAWQNTSWTFRSRDHTEHVFALSRDYAVKQNLCLVWSSIFCSCFWKRTCGTSLILGKSSISPPSSVFDRTYKGIVCRTLLVQTESAYSFDAICKRLIWLNFILKKDTLCCL